MTKLQTRCQPCPQQRLFYRRTIRDARGRGFSHDCGGVRQAHGMANFSSVLQADDVQAIRAYVVQRANQDKPAAAP
jgi:hypothetical protein